MEINNLIFLKKTGKNFSHNTIAMTFTIFLLFFQGNGLVQDISSSPHLNCALVCVLPTVVILPNQTSSRRHSHMNKLQQLNKIPFSILTGFPEKKIKQIEI